MIRFVFLNDLQKLSFALCDFLSSEQAVSFTAQFGTKAIDEDACHGERANLA